MKQIILLTFLIMYCFGIVKTYAQDLIITSKTPLANANNVARNANISITFDLVINAATLNNASIIVRGSQSGVISGVLTGGGTTTITFNPAGNFRLGEVISYTINTLLESQTGFNLVRGHTYSFTVISGPPPATSVTLAQRHVAFDFLRPENTASIDFEGDGDLDLVVTGEVGLGSGYTYVYKNDGNQEFCKRDKPVGQNINVELYDIDGDGDLDSFSAGGNGVNLDWNENKNDDGFFTKRPIITSNAIAWTVRGNDIDSDGDADLVAMMGNSNGTSNIKFYANNGAGVFSSVTDVSIASSGFETETYLHLADINTDGAMDVLAYRYNTKNIAWYQNNGLQVFTENIIINKPENQTLSTADIDGDGDIDLLSVGTSSVLELAWYENDGSENFTPHPVTITNTKNVRLDHIRATDVDGDLDMDLLAAAYWFENDGSENFTQNQINDGMDRALQAASYGDMDNDGDMDLLTIGPGYNWNENERFMNVTAISPANAGFSVAANTNIQITFDQLINPATLNNKAIVVTSKLRGLVPGTFTGGGTNTITFNPTSDLLPGEDIEVAVTKRVRSLTGHALEINYGIDFKVKVSVAVTPTFTTSQINIHANAPTGMDIADMDGDGDIDAVSCSSTELLLHQNDGLGNFTTTAIPRTIVPQTVHATDFNKDGKMDIIVYASLPYIYLNDGSQNFTETLLSGGGFLNTHGLADVDRDGDTDIIYGSRWADRNCNLFDTGTTATIAGTGRSEKIADLDGDGDMDFMKATSSTSAVQLNDGYLNWTALNIDISTVSADLADFDEDGDFDVLSSLSNSLAWYDNKLNTASLNFGTRKAFGTALNYKWAAAADLDGDGDADVAAISQTANRVVWYRNQLNEVSNNFSAIQSLPNSSGPTILKVADMNSDGTMDLVILSNTDKKLSWYANTGAACTAPQITTQPQTATVCEGKDYTLSVAASGNQPLTFQWQKDGVNISGATTSTLSFNPIDENDEEGYQCVVTNTCGTITSAQASIFVIPSPSSPTIIGDASCVAAAITLTASGGTEGSYQWYDVASGGTPISGETSSTYTTPIISATTTFYATITNGSCESTRTSVLAEIKPFEKPLLSSSVQALNGTVNICEGDALIITAPTGFATYAWSNDSISNPVTITTSIEALTLQVTHESGCTVPTTDALEIIVNPYPIAIITPGENQLNASVGDGYNYQWFYFDEPISGAANQSLEVNFFEYGEYAVSVTLNGCATRSDEFLYLITENESGYEGLKIYPNPVKDKLIVEVDDVDKIEIINTMGVITEPLVEKNGNQHTLNNLELSSGQYILCIKSGLKRIYIRFVKY